MSKFHRQQTNNITNIYKNRERSETRIGYYNETFIGNRLFNVQTIRVIKIENKKLGG